jgi:enoyl-CoA hydratase/carnithine racemase
LQLTDYYIDNQISVITLKNIENQNVLNSTSLEELNDSFNKAIEAKSRAVILRAAGDIFCNGMDFSFLIENSNDKLLAIKTISLYSDLLKQIYLSPVPVICVVNGSVKAGGIGLVGACDIVISGEKSTFELSEVIFGLVPYNVLPFIYSQRITPQKARYLVITAKKLNALEAKTLQLIDEVYPEAELEKNLKNLLKTIFRASPDAIALAKKFTAELFQLSFNDAITSAKNALIELLDKPKTIENVQKFRDGDVPEWFSKFKNDKPLII